MSLICTSVKNAFERDSLTTHSCRWPFGGFGHLRCGWTLRTARCKCLKNQMRGFETAPWKMLRQIGWGWRVQVHLMWDQLCGSAAVTLMMLFCDWGGGGGGGSGGGCHVWQEDRGSHRREKKAVMKDKPFVPTTEYWKLYFTAAILPNCFCASGWLFK